MKAISTVVLFAVMAIAFAQEAPSEGTDDSARGRPSGPSGIFARPPYGSYRPRPGTGWPQRPPTGFPGSGTGQISQPGIIWPGNQWQPGVIPQFPGINQPGIIPQFPGNQPGVIPQFPGNNPAFPGSGTRPLSPILVGNDPAAQTGNPPAGSGTRPLSPILIGDVPQTGNPPAGTGPGQTAPTLPGTDDGTLDSIVPAPAPGGSSLDDGARLTLGQPLRPSIGPFFTPEITLDGAFYDWLQQLLEDEIIEGSIAEGRPENST